MFLAFCLLAYPIVKIITPNTYTTTKATNAKNTYDNGDTPVFETTSADAALTTPFDFANVVNETVTVYAKYVAGVTVSFANTVIIMTSNAGSQKAETSLGFGKSTKDISKEKVLKALNEFLRPEFIGRVDEIVVFNPLDEEDYKKIAVLMMDEMKTVLKDKGIEFIYDDNTPSAIVSKMDGNVRGARDLRNVIRRNIEDKVSTLMIDNVGTVMNKILVTSIDNNIEVTFE